MKNDQIRKVLDEWDYDQAVQLYQEYCSDPAMARVLSSGENKFFTQQLKSLLKDCLDPEPPVSLGARASYTEAESVGLKRPRAHQQDKPPAVIAIEQRRNRALSRQDQLRWENVLCVEAKAPRSKLAELATEIVALGRELRECWDQLYYYECHGQLPPPPPDPVLSRFDNATNVADLTRIRNNARSNVSRAKTEEKKEYWKSVEREADRRISQAI